MTKKLCVVVFIFSVLGFCSCTTANPSAKSSADLDAGSNADLEWDGLYTGTVPGADSAIHVEITLKRDGTYNVSYQYIDKSDDVFTYTGTFTWKDNNTVELDDNELPPYYLVGENTLTQLDMAGEKIDGEHADMYVLKKE